MNMKLNSKKEAEQIIKFIKAVLKKHGFEKVVIGLSGGIDSTVAFYLLKDAIGIENIIIASLYYKEPDKDIRQITKDIPKGNIINISIKKTVDDFADLMRVDVSSKDDNHKIRLGNIMARVRMIVLYDLAKKNKALVCGTENKSEFYLGYFTRFGDEASDFEPIRHLYKTQLIELAKYLKIPKTIINKKPTAGLWKDQTDENELGFSYKEADEILYLHFEKKLTVEKIIKKSFKKADKVIEKVLNNNFKHKTPYFIK